MGCKVLDSPKTVRIVPVISRDEKGQDIPEVGAGGGLGDLKQAPVLELTDDQSAARLMDLISRELADETSRERAIQLIRDIISSNLKSIILDDDTSAASATPKDNSLVATVQLLEKIPIHKQRSRVPENFQIPKALSATDDLPIEIVNSHPARRTPFPIYLITSDFECFIVCIRFHSHSNNYQTFPYSRHSSYRYNELCDLLRSFQPRDVFPCTVDENSWCEETSVKALFGHLCSSDVFAHDNEMFEKVSLKDVKRVFDDTDEETQGSDESQVLSSPPQHAKRREIDNGFLRQDVYKQSWRRHFSRASAG